jgi:hypothetical protein
MPDLRRSLSHFQKFLIVTSLALLVVWLGGIVYLLVTWSFPQRALPPVESVVGGGFTGGFWHGFQGVIWAILELFGEDRLLYQIDNEGSIYDFGYLVGVFSFVNLVRLPALLTEGFARAATGAPVLEPDEDDEDEESWISRLVKPVLSLLLLLVMFAVASPEAFEPATWPVTPTSDAGFWLGLLHGTTAMLAFIISLFSDTVTIYQASVAGAYDIGYRLPGMLFFAYAMLAPIVLLPLWLRRR